MERLGKKPTDHMKDNRNTIRAIAQKNREEEEEQNKAQKDPYKLSQFRNVESRVYNDINNTENIGNHEERHFLTKGSATIRRKELENEGKSKRMEVERRIEEAKQESNAYAQLQEDRKTSVPRADDVMALAPRNNANFISNNKEKALSLKPPPKQNDEGPTRHEAYGRVPDYLADRNARKLEYEEERRRNAPDPNCPKGMKRMSEDERVETLHTLDASRSECLHQLEKLPFVIETPSLKRRADGLESKLKEIENAIAIFSKPIVYVALGS